MLSLPLHDKLQEQFAQQLSILTQSRLISTHSQQLRIIVDRESFRSNIEME